MNDIVKRLRNPSAEWVWSSLMLEAADEIERLQAAYAHAVECFRSCDEEAQKFRAELERLRPMAGWEA